MSRLARGIKLMIKKLEEEHDRMEVMDSSASVRRKEVDLRKTIW